MNLVIHSNDSIGLVMRSGARTFVLLEFVVESGISHYEAGDVRIKEILADAFRASASTLEEVSMNLHSTCTCCSHMSNLSAS